MKSLGRRQIRRGYRERREVLGGFRVVQLQWFSCCRWLLMAVDGQFTAVFPAAGLNREFDARKYPLSRTYIQPKIQYNTMGVALWLTPKPTSQISETLTSLSTGLDPLFSDSVRFEPHVTITSQLAVNSQADVHTVLSSALAALGSNFHLQVKFSSLFIKDKNPYFKKIYIGLEKTKNLTSFANILRELYVELPSVKKEVDAKVNAEEWAKNTFEPHLSLVYTNTRHFDNALVRIITTRVEDYLNLTDIEINTPYELTDYELGWSGGVLKIVNCEGPVDEWQVLGTAEIH